MNWWAIGECVVVIVIVAYLAIDHAQWQQGVGKYKF